MPFEQIILPTPFVIYCKSATIKSCLAEIYNRYTLKNAGRRMKNISLKKKMKN